MFDILIKNGEVLDGLGKNPAKKMDVGIAGGRITDLAQSLPEAKAATVIDAAGKIVAPGFIDIQNHSDSYWTLFDQPGCSSLISQGITTAVIGNCGSSLAPITNIESIKTIQKWHNLTGINVNWSTFSEFLVVLNGKIGINVGSLVGHATLRRGLLADSVRPATSDEISVMNKLLWQSLKQGAFGLSLGLVYAHEVNSSAEELQSLSQTLKSADGYLSVHLRSEGGHVLESLDEVIELASRAGIKLKISHFKIQNKKNWQLGNQALKKIEDAYHKGLDISFDAYPYHTSWGVLYTYLPKWAYEGGREQILKLIASPIERKKISEYLLSQEYDYKNIIIATSENNPGFIGKSVADIAQNSNVSGPEALMNVVAATRTQAVVFDRNLSDELVDEFLASPFAMVATDGAGYTEKGYDLVHPRCYGAMTKFLAWTREKKKISLQQAIYKITGEPARLLGLADRGKIAKGAAADIAVFDFNTVADKATYELPYQQSVGISQVVINGKLAFNENKTSGVFGKVLRKA